MARQLVQFVRLTDDIDGTEGDESTIQTVELGFEGSLYVLDLTHEHAEELRQILAPYMDAAHDRVKLPRSVRSKAVNDRPPYSRVTVERDKDARAQIRQWARENGYDIRGRGFIRADAVKAYREAHPTAYIPPSTLHAAEEVQ